MRHKPQAFTRLELLVVIVVLSLLGAFALPLLATTRRDSDRAACASNLYQIGHAILLWAGDHGDRVPWWTPVSDGGTMANKSGAAWFEWASLSNELATARVFACPADDGVRAAAVFDSSQMGFFNTALRDKALSYIVGLHVSLEYPDSLVCADRNLRSDVYPVGCSSGVNNADAMTFPFFTSGWTNAVHGPIGHMLVLDGRVEMTSSERLRALLSLKSSDQFATQDGSGNRHFLRAR